MDTSKAGYFRRVHAETPTEFWINNATLAEAEAAMAAGALCATTNPTYLARLLVGEPGYIADLIDDGLRKTDDIEKVVDGVHQRAVARLQKLFLPLFESSGGKHGLVAIQGDPRRNTDRDAILDGALRYRELGENIIIKVPSWPAGAAALEKLVEMGIPTIATLGFSVDQAVYIAEAYRRALKGSRTRPLCYVTFIAGVLETFLAESAERQHLPQSRELIRQGVCEASRSAYRIFKSRGYEAILLGGGARGPHHFTDLVGGQMAITIGWSIARQIIASDAPVVSKIDEEIPRQVIAELETHLPDFREAYQLKAMSPEEFHDFRPVASFQETFLQGTKTLLNAISTRMNSGALKKGEEP